MQGRVETAEDFQTREHVTLITLVPTRGGEARLLAKIRESGERTLNVRFDADKKQMRLVVPKHVADMPDSIGRGPCKKRG